MRPLAPGRALASLPAKVVAVLDKVERWLSSLPPNALTQGALLLVRRALGSAPTAGIKGVQVVLVNKTDLPITFGEGPSDDLASAKYLLRRLDPGQTTTIAHDYDRTKNSDVEVVIGTNFYQPRLIVQGSNHWDKAPTLLLRASPREDEELAPGQLYNTIYRAMYYDKGWLYDSWEPLAEGTGCHCDANNSGGPAQGGMRVYVARNRDEKDYKSFTVEIYELPAADLASNAYISTPHGLPNYYCDGNGKYGRFINGKG